MMMTNKKLKIILGPTAVGKTDYSIETALRYGSPVISCDSRQIYKDMSIVPEIKEVSVIDDCKIMAEINYKNEDQAILVVAIYDNHSKIICIQMKDVTQGGAEVIENLHIPQTQGTIIKVMLLKGLDTMIPLCVEKTVKYDSNGWVDET